MQQQKLISVLTIILFTLYFPTAASANYSPVQGRWLERDSMRYEDGMNLYEYSRSNPVVRTDAHGNTSTSAGQSVPTYSCKKGSGRQVKDPNKKGTSDCDVCCTLACLQNRNKKPSGRTVCCGKDPTSCVCDINIDNKFPGKGLDCFRKALKKCTGQHEPIHQKLVDCSGNKPTIIRTPTQGHVWKDPCDGWCSEYDAYKGSKRCIGGIDCTNCTDPASCVKEKEKMLKFINRRVEIYRKGCEECKAKEKKKEKPCPNGK